MWFADQLPDARTNDVAGLDKEELPLTSGKLLDERTTRLISPFKSELKMKRSANADSSGLPGSSPDASVEAISRLDVQLTSQGSRSRAGTIDWRFDKLGGKSILALSKFGNGIVVMGISIDGINMSDLPLTQIRAIIKFGKSPDGIELVLSVAGQRVSGGTVPPRTPFSLVYKLLEPNGMPIDAFVSEFGGVLFSFKYALEDKQRTLITYFSESSLKGKRLEAANSSDVRTPGADNFVSHREVQ